MRRLLILTALLFTLVSRVGHAESKEHMIIAIADTMRSTNSAAVSMQLAKVVYSDLQETSRLTSISMSRLVTGFVRLKQALGGTSSAGTAVVRKLALLSIQKRVGFEDLYHTMIRGARTGSFD